MQWVSKFHKIMQTLEKSMKFSHQIGIPYRSFFAVWMQQYAYHFNSIFEFTNLWYCNAGNLGLNLKTKTSDIYFLHKMLAVTVLWKHQNLDASKLTVLHGIVFAHEMYKCTWCNSNTICIYVYTVNRWCD